MISISKFQDVLEQRAWANRWELFGLVFIIFSSIWLEGIYLWKPAVFLLIACQFAPQIYKSTVNGYRSVPDLPYAFASLAYTLFLPLYMYGVEGNVLFIRPDSAFTMAILTAVTFQLFTIKIQQSRPRFLIPRGIRKLMLARRRAR